MHPPAKCIHAVVQAAQHSMPALRTRQYNTPPVRYNRDVMQKRAVLEEPNGTQKD